MKKLLLLLAGCLFAGSTAFAQDEAEPETPAITPGWTISANCLEPSGIETIVYNMTSTGITKTSATSEVYYADVALPVYPNHPNPKPSKYQYVISYTAEDGTQKTQTQQITQQIADGDINVTISAWLDASGNIVSYTSVANYILADTNWTGIVYLPASSTGDSNTYYFNARANNVVAAMRGLNAGSSTTQFLAGNNNQYQGIFISDMKENAGICSATIDYRNSTVVINNVSEIVLSISDYLPFVAPADVTLPSGVTAYVYDKLEDGVLYLKALDSNVVAYNTPVILKADTPDNYTLTISGDCQYNPQGVGTRTLLLDVNEENSIFYGVLQSHFLPGNAFYFNGTEFVKATNTQTVINPFSCYIIPTDAVENLDAITIVFPEEEEPVIADGYYLGSNMTASDGGEFAPNHSYMFRQGNDANTLTLTVGSVSSAAEFYVLQVTDGKTTPYSAEGYTKMIPVKSEPSLEANNESVMTLDNNYVNVTFTLILTEDGTPSTLSYNGTVNQDSWIVSPGNDQTMQSGTVTGNSIDMAVALKGAALIYIYVPSAYVNNNIYYTITEEVFDDSETDEDAVEDSDNDIEDIAPLAASDTELTPKKAYLETDAVGTFFTVGVKKGYQGEINVYTSNDVTAEPAATFTYTVSPTAVPTAVETIRATVEDGVIYNIFGQRVDESYKGIVIRNGKKYIQR